MMWLLGMKSGCLWAANEKLCISIRMFSFHENSVCTRGGNVDRNDRGFRDRCGVVQLMDC